MNPSRQVLVCFTLLWLLGTALRLSMLAVPPLILSIRNELHLTATEVGLLSGLPMVMLALAAMPGSLLIARLGSRTTLIAGLLVAAIGGALRGGAWNVSTLYFTTAMMGAGVAIMQPAMPVVVREWLPTRIGLATAIYSNGLIMGEILPVWLAPVVLPLVDNGWRPGLAIWSVPALLIALAMVIAAPKQPTAPVTIPVKWWPDWRAPLIWRLGILFGSANAAYFAGNAFVPAYLGSIGRDDLIQNALTALNLGQLPASLLIVAAAQRLERRAWPYIAAGAALIVSVIGLVYIVGPWTIVWAALLGYSTATVLVLGLTLPALLTEQEDVGRTSAAMFTLSYAIAMTVSVLCGAAWDLSGVPSLAFVPIGACALSLVLSAFLLKARQMLL